MNSNGSSSENAERAKIYRVSKSWQIFAAVVTPVLIFLGAQVITGPWRLGRSNESDFVLFATLGGTAMIVGAIYNLISMNRNRIELRHDSISVIRFHASRKLRSEDIAGFRIEPFFRWSVVRILPNKPQLKRIITVLIVENASDVIEWVNQHAVDLDRADYESNLQRTLSDSRLGSSTRQRQGKLASARRWAEITNTIGLAVLFWVLVKPEPYNYLIWTCVLFPIVSLVSILYFKGALGCHDHPKPVRAEIQGAFIGPILGLILCAVSDWSILEWNTFWFPFAVVAAACFALVLYIARDLRDTRMGMLVAGVCCLLYGYGSIITLNGILDNTEPTLYRATMLEKSESRTKSKEYSLKLSPWGPRQVAADIEVEKAVHDRYEVGNEVEVVVRGGRFGIPWFYVR